MTDDPRDHEVRVSGSTSRIDVVAEQRADVAVEGRAAFDRDGSRVEVRGLGGRLVIRVPVGADVVVGSASGSVRLSGALGSVGVVSESGRVEVGEAARVDVRTASGRVEVARAGDCRVRTDSGRVEIESCRAVDVAADSGRIVLRGVDGDVRAHCVSGRIEVTMLTPHDVVAETVTGRVSVSLPDGTRVRHIDPSATDDAGDAGDPAGFDCTVVARSVSGRVTVSTR